MPDVSLPPTHPDDEIVTRKILREELSKELSNYPTKADLNEALSNYPTKADLNEALSNYPTKADLNEALSNYPTKADLNEALSNYPTHADIENLFARHFKALEESIRSWVNPMFDPYRDNPDRIQKLERQSEGHEVRIASLEAPRRVRRKPAARAKPKRR